MRTILIPLSLIVLLAGCATTPTPSPTESVPEPSVTSVNGIVIPNELLVDVPVSEACLEAFRLTMGRIDSPEEAEANMRALLEACTTPEEFVSAFRIDLAENPPENPFAADEFVGLIVLCLNSIDRGIESELCDSAGAEGWLDDLPSGTSPSPDPPGTG